MYTKTDGGPFYFYDFLYACTSYTPKATMTCHSSYRNFTSCKVCVNKKMSQNFYYMFMFFFLSSFVFFVLLLLLSVNNNNNNKRRWFKGILKITRLKKTKHCQKKWRMRRRCIINGEITYDTFKKRHSVKDSKNKISGCIYFVVCAVCVCMFTNRCNCYLSFRCFVFIPICYFFSFIYLFIYIPSIPLSPEKWKWSNGHCEIVNVHTHTYYKCKHHTVIDQRNEFQYLPFFVWLCRNFFFALLFSFYCLYTKMLLVLLLSYCLVILWCCSEEFLFLFIFVDFFPKLFHYIFCNIYWIHSTKAIQTKKTSVQIVIVWTKLCLCV